MQTPRMFLLLILSLQGLHAQEDTAHHREVYAAINAQEKSMKVMKATFKDDETVFELKGWTDGKELRKILAVVPGEDGDGSEEYYLENGKPLFVFSQYHMANPDDAQAPIKVENRFYFKDGKPFKWLNSDKKTVGADDPDFASEAERLSSNYGHFLEAFKGKEGGNFSFR